MSVHYLNGRWLEEKDMKISAFDLAIMRGIAVFDYLRTYNKKPFLLERHYERLVKSARTLGIHVPMPLDELLHVIQKGINKNSEIPELGLRIILTGGVNDKFGDLSLGKPSVIVLFEPFKPPSARWYKDGIKLKTLRDVRIMPEAKTSDYKLAFVGITEAKRYGADDILYVGAKEGVLESSTSNFFIVKDGSLVTSGNDVLGGITRMVVIKLACSQGIEVREETLNLQTVFGADEAFITASNKEIVPVAAIDNQQIGVNIPGVMTARLQKLYKDFVRKHSL